MFTGLKRVSRVRYHNLRICGRSYGAEQTNRYTDNRETNPTRRALYGTVRISDIQGVL